MPTSEPDVIVRREGRAGRITLNRPDALNALTPGMVAAIRSALSTWAGNPAVRLVAIDGAGERAFCAGGDLAGLYHAADTEAARGFWRDEYAMNRALHRYPKPVVTFLHGFCMGGGVGLGCHAAHRITGPSARIALPECAVGLVPDVGGTLLLARAPGRLGEYLGLTGDRMDAADAVHAGFADHVVPEADWPGLRAELCRDGDVRALADAATDHGPARLAGWRAALDPAFAGAEPEEIRRALAADGTAACTHAGQAMDRNAPLAMSAALRLIRQVRRAPSIETALALEYRYVHRALAQGDFREGIRAAVIDKDRTLRWTHAPRTPVPEADVRHMTRPLGAAELTFEGES